MILNEQDFERTVKIEPGEVINIRLKENPTTGYRWRMETESEMQQMNDRFSTEETIGATGVHEFQFSSRNPGTYELRFKKWREWEGEGSVIDRFAVKIIVNQKEIPPRKFLIELFK
jgi:inhibitor of cysteine peptidase